MRILDSTETAMALSYARLDDALMDAALQMVKGDTHLSERKTVEIDKNSLPLGVLATAAAAGISKRIAIDRRNDRFGLPTRYCKEIVLGSGIGRQWRIYGNTVFVRRINNKSSLAVRTSMQQRPHTATHINAPVTTRVISHCRIAACAADRSIHVDQMWTKMDSVSRCGANRQLNFASGMAGPITAILHARPSVINDATGTTGYPGSGPNRINSYCR